MREQMNRKKDRKQSIMANILKQHTPNSNRRKKQTITYRKSNEHNYIITGIRKQFLIIALNKDSLSSPIDYNEKSQPCIVSRNHTSQTKRPETESKDKDKSVCQEDGC